MNCRLWATSERQFEWLAQTRPWKWSSASRKLSSQRCVASRIIPRRSISRTSSRPRVAEIALGVGALRVDARARSGRDRPRADRARTRVRGARGSRVSRRPRGSARSQSAVAAGVVGPAREMPRRAPPRSVIATSSPRSSIARYQASCACVIAQACSGECQPGEGCRRREYRAICVATQRPTPPRRISANDTVPLPRSGRSVCPCSRARISSMGRDRSRFHSMAFIARSRCASTMSMFVCSSSLQRFKLQSRSSATAGTQILPRARGPTRWSRAPSMSPRSAERSC